MGEKKRRYVERFRYEGFESEEEARKFIEEADRFFVDMWKRMDEHFRHIDEWFRDFWRIPVFAPREVKERPKKYYREVGEDVAERLDKLEGDVKEIKEILLKKYIKKKPKEAEEMVV